CLYASSRDRRALHSFPTRRSSDLNPEHERAVAKVCRDLGFSQVSVSHEVSPLIKLVGRGDTTVVDAYLSPILRRYVERVAQELGDRKSTRLNSSHVKISYAVFCLK